MGDSGNGKSDEGTPEQGLNVTEMMSDLLLGALHAAADVLRDELKQDPQGQANVPPPLQPPCHMNEDPPIERVAKVWAWTKRGSIEEDVKEALRTCAKEYKNCVGECAQNFFEMLLENGPICAPVPLQIRWGHTANYLFGSRARFHYKCGCSCLRIHTDILFAFLDDSPWWARAEGLPQITDPDGQLIDYKSL